MYYPIFIESIVPLSTDIIPWVVPDTYSVSNYGKVFYKYYPNTPRNEVPIFVDNTVRLLAFDKSYKEVKLDKLVYTHFVGPISINHKLVHVDNNIYNNRVDNLQMIHERFDDDHRVRKTINRAQLIAAAKKDPSIHVPEYVPKQSDLERVAKNSTLSDIEMSKMGYARNPQKLDQLYYLVGEEWRPVVGYPEIQPWYRVSNYGNVFSLVVGKKIRPSMIDSGYYRVQLINLNGVKKDLLVHVLVALAFIPNDDPINKTTVNHIDGNRKNNRADNLEWASLSDNSKMHVKEREDFNKETVIKICEALQAGMSYEDICFKVLRCPYDSHMHKRLYRIHKRNSFTDISMNYTF